MKLTIAPANPGSDRNNTDKMKITTTRPLTVTTPARANWWESANITMVRLARNLHQVGDVAAIADPKGKYGIEGRHEIGAEVAYRRDGRADLMGLLGL